MATRFTASEFTQTQFRTALDKAKLANAIVKFIESGFDRAKFTKSLYNGLNSMFGHIAHYDIHGFYGTWFEDDRDRLNWCEHVLRSHDYGDPEYTLVDVERVIRTFVAESGLVETYRQHVADVLEAQERAQLARLKAKYEGD